MVVKLCNFFLWMYSVDHVQLETGFQNILIAISDEYPIKYSTVVHIYGLSIYKSSVQLQY